MPLPRLPASSPELLPSGSLAWLFSSGRAAAGDRAVGAFETVEKVLIRVVGCPDRVRQVGLAAVALVAGCRSWFELPAR